VAQPAKRKRDTKTKREKSFPIPSLDGVFMAWSPFKKIRGFNRRIDRLPGENNQSLCIMDKERLQRRRNGIKSSNPEEK
jgi:hypothetical protein